MRHLIPVLAVYNAWNAGGDGGDCFLLLAAKAGHRIRRLKARCATSGWVAG